MIGRVFAELQQGVEVTLLSPSAFGALPVGLQPCRSPAWTAELGRGAPAALQRDFARLELGTRPDGNPRTAFGRCELAEADRMWSATGRRLDHRRKAGGTVRATRRALPLCARAPVGPAAHGLRQSRTGRETRQASTAKSPEPIRLY